MAEPENPLAKFTDHDLIAFGRKLQESPGSQGEALDKLFRELVARFSKEENRTACADHDLIAFGRSLQTKRAELEAERKKLGTALDQIKGELLVRFNREKRQTLRTEAGLAYVSELHSTTVVDREVFLDNVIGICEDAMKVSVDSEWLTAWKLDHPDENFPGTETTTLRKVNLRS